VCGSYTSCGERHCSGAYLAAQRNANASLWVAARAKDAVWQVLQREVAARLDRDEGLGQRHAWLFLMPGEDKIF
jgi:phage protein U